MQGVIAATCSAFGLGCSWGQSWSVLRSLVSRSAADSPPVKKTSMKGAELEEEDGISEKCAADGKCGERGPHIALTKGCRSCKKEWQDKCEKMAAEGKLEKDDYAMVHFDPVKYKKKQCLKGNQ